MGEVDIFTPFRRRTAEHEDRLTWSLLVALKYSPDLQRYFRDLVLGQLPQGRWKGDRGWEPAVISTQTGQIGEEASLIVSVLISDRSLPDTMEVEASDRRARYDGVIEFVDGLVLIVENKPSSANVWAAQLSPSVQSLSHLTDSPDIFERAVTLEWGDLLEGVLNFTGSRVASFPEREIASDFLAFVEELHPPLSPYQTYELCGERPEALKKRTAGLLRALGEELGFELGVRPGNRPFVQLPFKTARQLHIRIKQPAGEEDLLLRPSIWPGDTVRQARAFFKQVEREAFLSLPQQDWNVMPNLHFSHIQKHLVWADTPMSLAEYFDYFVQHPDEIGRRSFEDEPLDELISGWKSADLISDRDSVELTEEFGETQRGFLNMIPGFSVWKDWPISRVIELESAGTLEQALINELQLPLSTWGDELRSDSSV